MLADKYMDFTRMLFQALSASGGRLPALVLAVGLWACEGEQQPPADLIAQDKMAEILTDIHIAEAKVTAMRLGSMDSSLKVYEQMQQDIWRANKVDTSLYRKSYSFYTSHPSYLAEIYDQVEKNLEAREKKKNIKF